MILTLNKVVTIEVSLADMARAFADANSAEQAQFLNLVAHVSSDYPKPRVFQWQHIADEEYGLNNNARDMVREWSEYFCNG